MAWGSRLLDRLIDRYVLWVIRRAGRRFARRIRAAQRRPMGSGITVAPPDSRSSVR
jgi:hypothetical protein